MYIFLLFTLDQLNKSRLTFFLVLTCQAVITLIGKLKLLSQKDCPDEDPIQKQLKHLAILSRNQQKYKLDAALQTVVTWDL